MLKPEQEVDKKDKSRTIVNQIETAADFLELKL